MAAKACILNGDENDKSEAVGQGHCPQHLPAQSVGHEAMRDVIKPAVQVEHGAFPLVPTARVRAPIAVTNWIAVSTFVTPWAQVSASSSAHTKVR